MNKQHSKKNTSRKRTRVSRKAGASHRPLSLKKYAHDLNTFGPRLQRLAQAIATSPDELITGTLSCAGCEALLEFYVDAERRNEKASTLFSTVFNHLKTCNRCNTSYRLLAETWNPPAHPNIDAILASTPPLPFLSPKETNAPWTKHTRSRVAGAPLKFGFVIQALHVRQQLSLSYTAVSVRQATASAKRRLLLSDTISLGDRNVAVNVWAQRLEAFDRVRIDLLVASSTPLPEPLQVNVTWNNQAHSGLVQNGQYSCDEFPVLALESEGELRIEFQVEENPATNSAST